MFACTILAQGTGLIEQKLLARSFLAGIAYAAQYM